MRDPPEGCAIDRGVGGAVGIALRRRHGNAERQVSVVGDRRIVSLPFSVFQLSNDSVSRPDRRSARTPRRWRSRSRLRAFLSPVALSDSYRSPATARRWSISGDGDPFRSRATWNSVCSAMPHAQQTRLRSWLLPPCSHRLPAHRRFRPRHPLFGLHLYGPPVPGGLARLEAGLALFLRRLPGTRPAHGLWVGDAVARSGMRSVASAVGLVVLSIARLPAVTP